MLQWVTTGFVLFWIAGQPQAVWQKNHRSAPEHAAFLGEAVRELVLTGTAIAVPEQPHCVLPLGVVCHSGSGKKRLILDARYIND